MVYFPCLFAISEEKNILTECPHQCYTIVAGRLFHTPMHVKVMELDCWGVNGNNCKTHKKKKLDIKHNNYTRTCLDQSSTIYNHSFSIWWFCGQKTTISKIQRTWLRFTIQRTCSVSFFLGRFWATVFSYYKYKEHHSKEIGVF